ncbi:hypothetical protein RIF29_17791 [Crotalaria pallida]|uniref:Uncharacterized protein n=1 Tax=Crotalaria pallida TaxID=3830 RepID=A0AAN9FHT8_CROPI
MLEVRLELATWAGQAHVFSGRPCWAFLYHKTALTFKLLLIAEDVEVEKSCRDVLRSHESCACTSAHVFSGRPCWIFLYHNMARPSQEPGN